MQLQVSARILGGTHVSFSGQVLEYREHFRGNASGAPQAHCKHAASEAGKG